MLSGHWTATRFAQKPVEPPPYAFSNVPKAERDLKGSSLQRTDNRDHFLSAMAEMVLLCKEAVRRRPAAGRVVGSKPLSLEYLADRFDVDDPLFGYIVRTDNKLGHHPSEWQKGMLQGFITVTTFTNWQKSFRWDSLNEAAFGLDDDDLEEQRLNGERRMDENGDLARELEATVRCGDIWNEGIVWPRIAELSLLGALGCGRALVSLLIEELETMKSSGRFNYDYIVLQATDNSIPFYESMGFIRVGALEEDDDRHRRQLESCSSDSDEEIDAETADKRSQKKPDGAAATPSEIVTSPITKYTVTKAGEVLNEIAKQLKVDVWDIVFLNRAMYENLTATSRLLQGTVLQVPDRSQQPAKRQSDSVQWYVAEENETPRMIARRCEVNCLELVEANRTRLPGLMSNSRLKRGTRIKVSHFHVQEALFKPYAHWSFPDERFEDPEPSYMMALKLNRRRGHAAPQRHPFKDSLAVPVSKYEPPEHFLTDTRKEPDALVASKPNPPRKPIGAFVFYLKEQRRLNSPGFTGTRNGEVAKSIAMTWAKMAPESKIKYENLAEDDLERYRKEKEIYKVKLSAFEQGKSCPKRHSVATSSEASEDGSFQNLFNAVVRLKPGTLTEGSFGSEFTYWYVLTFIPDLKWCHLAPMHRVGTFGRDKPKVAGRPKWKLVDENLGKEIDVSSSSCIPINVRSVKKTADADKEEWDIIDDGSIPSGWKGSTPGAISRAGSEISFVPSSKNSLTKKRKFDEEMQMPRLIAAIPGTDQVMYVKLLGRGLARKPCRSKESNGIVQTPSAVTPGKKRGRPKGSKNKPKPAKGDSSADKKIETIKEGSGANILQSESTRTTDNVARIDSCAIADKAKAADGVTPKETPPNQTENRPLNDNCVAELVATTPSGSRTQAVRVVVAASCPPRAPDPNQTSLENSVGSGIPPSGSSGCYQDRETETEDRSPPDPSAKTSGDTSAVPSSCLSDGKDKNRSKTIDDFQNNRKCDVGACVKATLKGSEPSSLDRLGEQSDGSAVSKLQDHLERQRQTKIDSLRDESVSPSQSQIKSDKLTPSLRNGNVKRDEQTTEPLDGEGPSTAHAPDEHLAGVTDPDPSQNSTFGPSDHTGQCDHVGDRTDEDPLSPDERAAEKQPGTSAATKQDCGTRLSCQPETCSDEQVLSPGKRAAKNEPATLAVSPRGSASRIPEDSESKKGRRWAFPVDKVATSTVSCISSDNKVQLDSRRTKFIPDQIIAGKPGDPPVNESGSPKSPRRSGRQVRNAANNPSRSDMKEKLTRDLTYPNGSRRRLKKLDPEDQAVDCLQPPCSENTAMPASNGTLRRSGRTKKFCSSVSSETVPVETQSRRAVKHVELGQQKYPSRNAAQPLLCQSPLSNLPEKTAKKKASTIPTKVAAPVATRPKRGAAPTYLGEELSRKRRKVNSTGSRRSILQN